MSVEPSDSSAAPAPAMPTDFVRDIVAQHVTEKRYPKIVTRFPPEPNGYLHIGHAKSICLNFGLARENNGTCNLRFDDTNPAKEEIEYVESITTDVQWLIAGWADHCLGFKPKGTHPAPLTSNGQPDFYLGAVAPGAANSEPFFASDYFDALHGYALELIQRGKAYVCDLTPKETEEYRGAPDKPGRESPFRHRSVAENLDLFQRMTAGEFPDGARSLRSKIDMTSPNMWLRDPLLYRIRHIPHYHAGAQWCVYPLYDYAHCLSDYLEGVTHSVCSLEFVPHRPLYDWVLENLGLPRPVPHQYEFAKLVPTYTLLSKRNILRLVQEKIVHGWDDPRLPTLSGLRRRGIPASALRKFVIGVGVTTFNSVTDIAVFEHAVREELNTLAHRRLAVLRPIKIVLTNLAENETVDCLATNDPQNEISTTRTVVLTREVFIESDDFAEVPPPKYFRLKPGGEVRLKYACIIKLDEIVKDAAGVITELRCTADLTTRAGFPNSDKKVKGTIHWVSAARAIDAEVRLYDRLFTVPEPGAEEDFLKVVNPHSLEVVTAKLEPSLATATPTDRFSVRTSRLFHPRSEGQHARQTDFQSHDFDEGQLGEEMTMDSANPTLSAVEVRVLGSLIEKQITTPDYYPLSLNALTNACNQLTNREPVLSLHESEVARAIDSLREKRLATSFHGAESRVPKFKHTLTDAVLLTPAEIAVLCVLFLRGAQTIGELRTRGERFFPFESLGEVEETLQALSTRTPEPLVAKLPRQPGLKESRHAHLFSGKIDTATATVIAPALSPAEPASPAVSSEAARIAALETEAATLRGEFAELQRQFGEFRKQFE